MQPNTAERSPLLPEWAFVVQLRVETDVAQRHLEGRLPRRPIERIYLDDLKSVTGNHPGTDPAPRAKPDNLAYVIYTSGSTGKPKGGNRRAGVNQRPHGAFR